MNIGTFSLVLSGVLLNAIAQLLLKSGTNVLGDINFHSGKIIQLAFKVFTEYHIFAGIICYVVSLGLWIMVLSKLDVSIAYPMLSIGYVINAIAAWYLFGEVLSAQKLSGIFIIIVGVVFVARS